MEKDIKYCVKQVYGVDTKYPLHKEAIVALVQFNGHKTLTNSDINAFKALGFTFTEVLAPKKGN